MKEANAKVGEVKKAQENEGEAGIFDPKANAFLALGAKVVKSRTKQGQEKTVAEKKDAATMGKRRKRRRR